MASIHGIWHSCDLVPSSESEASAFAVNVARPSGKSLPTRPVFGPLTTRPTVLRVAPYSLSKIHRHASRDSGEIDPPPHMITALERVMVNLR